MQKKIKPFPLALVSILAAIAVVATGAIAQEPESRCTEMQKLELADLRSALSTFSLTDDLHEAREHLKRLIGPFVEAYAEDAASAKVSMNLMHAIRPSAPEKAEEIHAVFLKSVDRVGCFADLLDETSEIFSAKKNSPHYSDIMVNCSEGVIAKVPYGTGSEELRKIRNEAMFYCEAQAAIEVAREI